MLRSTLAFVRSLTTLEARIEKIQLAIGRLEQAVQRRDSAFNAHEFSVFSQWGEDGLLHHILSTIEVPRRVFVEFGVENYREANTRFLLAGCEWSGLVLDGSAENIATIAADAISWRHTLIAKQAFVTADNIDALIRAEGIANDIGLLSIDIDGNDYWVWKAIRAISPRVVVVEYNSLFGPDRALVVPYRADFQRTKAHYSNLYYGASAKALVQLGREKGYSLVGGNLAGNNLFFVRTDVLGPMRPVDLAQAYRVACFRESRDAEGKLTFLAPDRAREVIRHLPIIDLDTGREQPLGSAGG